MTRERKWIARQPATVLVAYLRWIAKLDMAPPMKLRCTVLARQRLRRLGA